MNNKFFVVGGFESLMVLYPPTMYYCERNAERIELQFVGEHAGITFVSEV